MINRILVSLITAAMLIMTSGCERDVDLLEPATNPSFGEVFLDGFVSGLDYSAFANSKLDAFDIDESESYKGSSSIKITVPGENDPSGWFAGGAFYSTFPRDLSGYNVLSFWGKANKVATAQVGFGNDNTGNSKYAVMLNNVTFGTSWQKYYVPIPLASKLTAETGMLQYAAGADENGYGALIWFDEVQFENLSTIAYKRPVVTDTLVQGEVGEIVDVGVSSATINVDGIDLTVDAAPAYFTLVSSDESVAKPTADGKISAVSEGTAEITVKLGNAEASQKIKMTVRPAAPKPATPAPAPTVNSADVISMFSNVYTDVLVDTWNPFWEFSTAEVFDLKIDGDDVKRYTNLNFVGIEFVTQQIDASEMTHFHMDIWTPDPTDPPAAFKVLLVDFGPDGSVNGDDNTSHEVSITRPALVTEEWVSIDIPLSSFTGLTNRNNLAQLVLSGDPNTVYIDNVYFYDSGEDPPPTDAPDVAAPTPTEDAADVISFFSNAYSDVTVDTWNTGWEFSTTVLTDVTVVGDDTKLYTNLNFVGIEFAAAPVDVSAMNRFHMDIWTPDPTAAPAEFKIKLIDFGANGVFDGPDSDDSEHELTFTANTNPALASEEWVSIDVPMSAFAGLTSSSNLAQMVLSGDPNTVYVDNVYFYKGDDGTGGNEPTQAAPTPTEDAADVISFFSNAYSDVTVDTWNTGWEFSTAVLTDVTVAGDDTKLYTDLNFVGIEFASAPVDVSAMNRFHMDIWTPDPTAAPAEFKIKLIDFGANGVYDGPDSDDSEHELTFTANTNPALASKEWVSIDVPMSAFSGLSSSANLAQMVLSGDPNTVYVDNVYFYKGDDGTGGNEPTEAAPTPGYASADVISVFSDSYTNVAGTNFYADWGQSTVPSEVSIAGNNTLLYTGLNYQGIELGTAQDVSDLTSLHIDFWSSNSTELSVYLISPGPVETEYILTVTNGSWVSVDIPLTAFAPVDLEDVFQLKFVGNGDVYLDNILMHR